MGAAAVAAVVTMQEDQQVVDAFQAAGATTAASARTLESLGLARRGSVASLLRRGRLRETTEGRYYLSESGARPARGEPAVGVLTIVAALLVGGLLGLLGQRASQ